MNFAADELLEELSRIDAVMAEVVRRAGQGCGPDFERRLDARIRSLRPMLKQEDLEVAIDAIEAAKRVLISADPAAPLMMLAMARQTLNGVIRRQANRQRLRAA
jgi:hypothetical protein